MLRIGVIVALAVAGIGLNLLLRRLLRRLDSRLGSRPPRPAPPEGSEADVRRILQRWGRRGPRWQFPDEFLPLDPSIVSLAAEYEIVDLAGWVVAFSRQMVGVYDGNREYIVIGELGDGSPLVIRRARSDAAVYVVEIEDTDPHCPEPFAPSLPAYLCMAERLYQEGEREASHADGR